MKTSEVLSLLLFSVLLSACGAQQTTLPQGIYVTLAPETAQVHVHYSIQLRARVRNTTNSEVTWSLSGAGCIGAKCGTISDTGLYTAPANVPSPAFVTVTARSDADPSKSASATITILEAVVFSNQWIWVSGSDIFDRGGSFGTKGIADPSNVPGSRELALSWTGPDGTLWLFGGFGRIPGGLGFLNDLWKYDPVFDAWTWMSGSNRVDQAGVYGTKGTADPANVPGGRSDSATWIDASGNLWLFGGGGYDSNRSLGQLNDLWKYDTAANLWTWVSGTDLNGQLASFGIRGVPDPSNMPGGREAQASWVDVDGNFWLFGGRGFDTTPERSFGDFNDLWKFDPDSLEWTWISGSDRRDLPGIYGAKGIAAPTNVPGSRTSAVNWTGPDGGLWIFGGGGHDATGSSGILNDLWMFDPNTLKWTWISGSDLTGQEGSYGLQGVAAPTNVPGARCLAISWTDPEGSLWLFGGSGLASNGSGGRLNDLWKYDPNAGEWAWISGSSVGGQWGSYGSQHISSPWNMPAAREYAVSWIGTDGNLWLFGGAGQFQEIGGMFNDLWRYSR